MSKQLIEKSIAASEDVIVVTFNYRVSGKSHLVHP